MAEAGASHGALIATAVGYHDGRLIKARGEGDSTFTVFGRATDGLDAALDTQRALQTCVWPDGIDVRVRVALMGSDPAVRLTVPIVKLPPMIGWFAPPVLKVAVWPAPGVMPVVQLAPVP